MRTLALGSAAARRASMPLPELPRLRAPVVFGLFLLLFVGLAVRSVYLQGVDIEFLQEQGSSRYSRELDPIREPRSLPYARDNLSPASTPSVGAEPSSSR